MNNESKLARAYRVVYEKICGKHPYIRPWHFQWLDTCRLYNRLRQKLPALDGRVLDVGCGEKPYRNWFKTRVSYVGIDVALGPAVDIVVAPDKRWPFGDGEFDVVLCSQVLEHVEYLDLTLAEIGRVLKNGGSVVVSFPFLYNEHGAPLDFRRFTAYQAENLFPGFEIISLERLGGIGSTLALLFLNWLEHSLGLFFVTRLLKGLLLPFWIAISVTLNIVALSIDKIDLTDAFYHTVLLVAKKRGYGGNKDSFCL